METVTMFIKQWLTNKQLKQWLFTCCPPPRCARACRCWRTGWGWCAAPAPTTPRPPSSPGDQRWEWAFKDDQSSWDPKKNRGIPGGSGWLFFSNLKRSWRWGGRAFPDCQQGDACIFSSASISKSSSARIPEVFDQSEYQRRVSIKSELKQLLKFGTWANSD